MNQALSSNDRDHVAEQIVAYLDGELAPEEVRAVESCLASDARYREVLRSFQRSWDMLDALPRTDADHHFAASTVEMVALSAADNQGRQDNGWARQLFRQWTIAGFSVLAACLVGFGVTTAVAALLGKAGLIEGTNDALLRDAAVIENMDKYKLVADIEFLRAYAELPKLPGAAPPKTADKNNPQSGHPRQRVIRNPQWTPVNESTDELRGHLQQLSPAEKEQLSMKQERFVQLKPESQQQLREFHTALVQDPQSERLRRALDGYHGWYMSLPLEQRIDLRTLPAEELMKHVSFSHNVQAVLLWLEAHAMRNEASLMQGSHSFREDQLANLAPEMKRKRLMALLWARWTRQGAPLHPPVSQREMQSLLESLSPDVRKVVAEAGGVNEQWKTLVQTLIEHWGAKFTPTTTAAVAVTNSTYLPERQLQGLRVMAMAVERQERLMKFFREGLTPAERQRLEQLAPEKRFQQLQDLYKLRFQQRGGQRPVPRNRRFDGRGKTPDVPPDGTLPSTGATLKQDRLPAVRAGTAPATDLRSTIRKSDRALTIPSVRAPQRVP